MTEAQRDYLADLAARKGVRLEDTSNVSAAWASRKIEGLKALPDAEFEEPTPELDKKVDNMIANINTETAKWTFQA